jgi:CCR4-NOT transcription complex subunit 4
VLIVPPFFIIHVQSNWIRLLYSNTNFLTCFLFSYLDQRAFKFSASPSFNDPAIMSARFASPLLASAVPEGFHNSAPTMSPSQMAYGPPPGLTYPPGISPSPAPSTTHSYVQLSNVESQTNVSNHGEFFSLHIRGEGVPGQSTSTERRAFSVRKIHYRS